MVRFTPGEGSPDTPLVIGWVSPRSGLDAVAKITVPIIAPARN